MTPPEEIQNLLSKGDLSGAMMAVKAAIRKAPIDSDLRFMLFQLAAVTGDWEAASNQLVAYSELTGRQSPLPIVFNDVIRAEVRRKHVFLGEEAPTIFGEPPEWISYLVEALSHAAKGNYSEAKALRVEAMYKAPAFAGKINGEAFEWLADGDSRIGLLFEVIINGQYYWLPQSRVKSMLMEAPSQVRDVVWVAASITLENDATISAFIPVRYPGAAGWKRDALKLSKETDWDVHAENFYIGLGQRTFMTEKSEVSLLDIRTLEFTRD